ncbi:DUF1836 domain-containing protein [Virgibacillus halophilus]|uniref:DUF1836 domain-containing protein n=1 Tax=Tigheibacillus halophilus TaxID=361280 RepID=A0ABU5C9H6_9BACI|nr:DUF1836 domain-containing protein [Virgibacillus halophilus]
MKKDASQLLEEMNLDHYLSLEDIPDIDLYMDQVIQLFEKKFAGSKRNDEEKILTKTMINNYAKGKLFFPIQNKRYTKEHLILISLIYQLKSVLSISDIKDLLGPLNQKVFEDGLDLDQLYETFLHMREKDAFGTKKSMQENVEILDSMLKESDAADKDDMHRLLLITSFANISNFYKRAAEKLIDDMNETKEQDTSK